MTERSAGSRVGPYEIEAPLGRGGMGVVYRARDPRLGRQVAIKILPEELAADAERLARFEREARATAALDHPNLLAVYDVGVDGGAPYLVCELLEGETLRERLRRGTLPWRQAVEVTREIGAGLAAAHPKGVVHRDLKPENVFLLSDGRVKILDFGLATFGPETRVEEAALTAEATLERLTREGVALGTVGYMAPEQVEGRPADGRADIFGLGVVLFEMLAGRAPFERQTAIDSLHAILREDPPSLRAEELDVPQALERVVGHCLEKHPGDRYQSARDLLFDLELVESSSAVRRPLARPWWRTGIAVAVATIVAVSIATAVFLAWRDRGSRTAAAASRAVSVAVLPFSATGIPARYDHLAMGFADEVATALTYAKGIAVRPFSRSSRYSVDDTDLGDVGEALGANHLVVGRVGIEGDQLRVWVETVDVERDEVVWRDSWGSDGEDLLTLRETMRERVRRGLVPALGSDTIVEEQSHPQSTEAYDLYLRASATGWDPEANRVGIDLLERSVELDGEFAPAWLGLAARYQVEALLAEGADPTAAERAFRDVARALELDPGLFEAILFKVRQDAESGNGVTAFRRAVELVRQRPESGAAHAALGYVLRYGGALRESAEECGTAMRLDLEAAIRCHWTFTHLGEYGRSLELLDALSRSSQIRATLRADNLTRMGDRQRALAEVATIGDELAAVDIQRGCLRETRSPEVVEWIEERQAAYLLWPDPEALYWYGAVLSDCGLPEPALRFLEVSIDRGYCAAVALEDDPLWEPMRQDPRLAEQLRRARACRDRFMAQRVAPSS